MNAKSNKVIVSNEIFLEVMDKPISFQRAFVRVTGGILPALMLSQAVFLTRCTDDPEGWFWHTQDQWEKETGMTRFEQETAREKLLKTGFWHEKRVGVPAKMHFRIDVEKLQEKLFSGIDERQEAAEKRKEAKKADGGSGDNSPQTEAKAPARGKVSIKIARKQDCGNAAIQYVETQQSRLLDHSNLDCGNAAILIAATQHTCLQQPSIQDCGNVAISILERIKENEREGEIAGAPALSLSSGSDPKEKQDRAQQQETPIPPVARQLIGWDGNDIVVLTGGFSTWNEHARNTDNIQIGDSKKSNTRTSAGSAQEKRKSEKELPEHLKNSVLNMVTKLLIDTSMNLPTEAFTQMSCELSPDESNLDRDLLNSANTNLIESQFSTRLLVDQQVIWDGVVSYVGSTANPILSLRLIASFQGAKAASMWLETCRSFAQTVTNVKQITCLIGGTLKKQYTEHRLSAVSQALANAAKAEFEDTQPLPGEYLPGLPVPGKRRSARLAAENIAAARRFGFDERTFRLMVDALLTGTGKLLVANGKSEDAEKVHRQAQESILEIIGYSASRFSDETVIAKLVKSYKSYNEWQKQPPSNLQLMTHAARIISGDVSLDGLPQPQPQAQPQKTGWQANQPVPAQYAHLNKFNKPFTGSEK